MSNEVLDTLLPDNYVDCATLGRVDLKKVSLRTVKPVVALLTKIVDDLAETQRAVEAETRVALAAAGTPADVVVPSAQLAKFTDTSNILKLISKYFDEVVELLPLLCAPRDAHGSEQPFIDRLLDAPGDETACIVVGIVKLNQHFFMTQVLPILRNAKPAAGA